MTAVFGESGGAILKFGESAAKPYGLSAIAADTMNASMGQVLRSMGLGKQRSADMSISLVKMAADLGSFTNKNPADVFNALQKGTLGATRGLKQYGINISQTDVANQALAAGIVKPIKNTRDLQNAQIKMHTTTLALTKAIHDHGKGSAQAATATAAHNRAETALQKAMDGTVPKLTTAQKSLASYQLIMKAGAIASGDFRKHSHDLGNEQKILSAQFSNISDSIGAVLLPAITAAGGALITYVPKGLAAIKAGFNIVRPEFEAFKGAVSGIVSTASGFVSTLVHAQGVTKALGAFVGVLAGAFIAYQAALIVTRAAMAVAYVAQLALNAAMTANPIGIVVVAIAALVAGLVLLYQRSATARAIMDAAWGGIKAGAAAAFGFITNTVIPGAIAAWNAFGPKVVAVLQGAVNAIRTVIQAIATVVSTIVDQIRQHWDAVWGVFGPLVSGYLNAAKAVVTTVLNVITGLVRVFAALLRGDWSGAWNALKGIVSDVLNGVKTVVTSVLGGLAGTAKALASTVGSGIASGIKSAVEKLAGLAGDLVGKIGGVAGQVAGEAFNAMRQVGFSIADGVISGIGNLGQRIASTVGGFAKSAVGGALSAITGHSPSKLYADTVGTSIGTGVAKGVLDSLSTLSDKMGASLAKLATVMTQKVQPLVDQIASASPKAAAKLISEAKKMEAPVAQGFARWITAGKAAFDAQAAKMITTVEGLFTKAQARIDVWKAKATPTEALIAALQAKAAEQQVLSAVAAAKTAMDDAKVTFEKDWGDLLAQQDANMAKLKAAQGVKVTDAAIAGHEFQKSVTAAQGDPLAGELLRADQTLIMVKARYALGQASEAELFAAQDAFDAASLAAQGDTIAQTLLADFTTWQDLLAQQAAGEQAITDQTATDAVARQGLIDGYNTTKVTNQKTYDDALAAQEAYYRQLRADAERIHRDEEAAKLNTHLVERFGRFKTHLENVIKIHDAHFDALARMATKSGGEIGENLAKALRESIPSIDSAAQAVAATVKRYLKTGSPTEAGPMSDLDHWWQTLAPTLISGLDTSGLKAALSEAVTPPNAALNGRGQAQAGGGERWSSERMEMLLERIEKHTSKTAEQKPPGAPEIHVSGGFAIDASAYRSRR